ncbi:MAG: transcriptional regulator PpsR [Neomegalonema sp.]
MTRHETQFKGKAQRPAVSPDKFGAILASSCDLAIVVDAVGVVASISVNPENRSLGCLDHWEGRALEEFLTVESRPKLKSRLTALKKGDERGSKPFEINHVDNANWEFPIRYTAHPANDQGALILLGRDLRPIAEVQQQLVKAQMALEKDYERSRDFETRYRVLMEAMTDAVAIVDASTGRILSANSATARLLNEDVESLSGTSFIQAFEGRQRKEFLDDLSDAAVASSSRTVSARTRKTRKEVLIAPTLFRSAGEMILLCRIEAADKTEPVTEELRDALHALYEKGPDAVVITDARGDIRYANEGFLILCDIAQISDLRSAPLSDFLARGAIDLKVLTENAARTGRMRLYATQLKSNYGTMVPVEIAVTHLKDRSEPFFAMTIRDATRLDAPRDGAVSDEGVRNVMELVGSAPLKDLVAATTDVVEKMCIETAVELTRNNRVAAAEMLGLSRQSLYVKLRKYGLLDKNSDN